MAQSEHIKLWCDTERECFFADAARVYGRVCVTRGGGWEAFDCTRTNAARSGNLVIGHFRDLVEAKEAVEDWWKEVG